MSSKRPKKNGYKMPEPLPLGEVLQDLNKQQWILGPSIGKGGFGEIYSAKKTDTPKSHSYPYVIKIEPSENGPLFVERSFYAKNCQATDIENFKAKYNLKSLGVPPYLGSGSHELKDFKYRFLVLEKYGTDVDKLLKVYKGKLPPLTVFMLAHQMVYVLEYIHSVGYIHADLKGANILLGDSESNKNQAYLVDFGLACKFTSNKVFKNNPKKAHDGTIEYLSRDAHQGVPTRRGDLEVLAYNIIYWLGGKLPWEKDLKDPKVVHQKKEEAMQDIDSFLKKAFNKQVPPVGVIQFLKYINTLAFNDKPDYKKIRDIFKTEIETSGGSLDSPLLPPIGKTTNLKRRSLSAPNTPEKKIKKPPVKSRRRALSPEDLAGKQANGDAVREEQILTAAMKEVLEKKKLKEGANKKGRGRAKRNEEAAASTSQNKEEKREEVAPKDEDSPKAKSKKRETVKSKQEKDSKFENVAIRPRRNPTRKATTDIANGHSVS